jgi:hypothetical protein
MPTYRIVYGDNENVVTETYEDVVVGARRLGRALPWLRRDPAHAGGTRALARPRRGFLALRAVQSNTSVDTAKLPPRSTATRFTISGWPHA